MNRLPNPLSVNSSALNQLPVLLADVLTRGVVVARGWKGSQADFVELGRSFGVLERPSSHYIDRPPELFVVASNGDSSDANVGCYWHSDGFAHTSAPALLTIYHVAKGASPSAGTAFVDGHETWCGLGALAQKQLEGRHWMHVSRARHPFVLPHHWSGLPVLSVNLGRMVAIDEMDEDCRRKTIAWLSNALGRMPCYMHQWQEGDVVIADNRRLLHHAPKLVIGERVLWRVSVVSFSDEIVQVCDQFK